MSYDDEEGLGFLKPMFTDSQGGETGELDNLIVNGTTKASQVLREEAKKSVQQANAKDAGKGSKQETKQSSSEKDAKSSSGKKRKQIIELDSESEAGSGPEDAVRGGNSSDSTTDELPNVLKKKHSSGKQHKSSKEVAHRHKHEDKKKDKKKKKSSRETSSEEDSEDSESERESKRSSKHSHKKSKHQRKEETSESEASDEAEEADTEEDLEELEADERWNNRQRGFRLHVLHKKTLEELKIKPSTDTCTDATTIGDVALYVHSVKHFHSFISSLSRDALTEECKRNVTSILTNTATSIIKTTNWIVPWLLKRKLPVECVLGE